MNGISDMTLWADAALAKGSKPPPGFTPVAGSKVGLYHRVKAGGGFDYWKASVAMSGQRDSAVHLNAVTYNASAVVKKDLDLHEDDTEKSLVFYPTWASDGLNDAITAGLKGRERSPDNSRDVSVALNGLEANAQKIAWRLREKLGSLAADSDMSVQAYEKASKVAYEADSAHRFGNIAIAASLVREYVRQLAPVYSLMGVTPPVIN